MVLMLAPCLHFSPFGGEACGCGRGGNGAALGDVPFTPPSALLVEGGA